MLAIAGLSWRVPEPRVDTLREAVLLVERSGRGIYDALIIATARHANVRLVLSGDFADGESLEGVSIGDPLSAGFDVSH